MGNKKSKATGQSSSAKQTSVHLKGTTILLERINVQRVQNVLLIWLDSKIDDSNADCHNIIIQLRQVVNDVNTFTDGKECTQFVDNITNDKACMIISGALGEHMMPRIHNMSQVDSIFIFSDDKKYYEEWTKDWPKIKGVFTDILPICEALKQAAQQCEQNAISISFVATGDDIFKQNLDHLDPIFMYSQILKEILLTIKFDDTHIQEFLDHCRSVFAENGQELKNVAQLQTKYHTKTPIWWYTSESFLYPMLNCALRLMNMDIIIKMGFFIGDLHRHIEQLHSKQFTGKTSKKVFTVFRGQGMAKTAFDQMKETRGGLISFNSFLSTSKNRQVSLRFARRALPNMDLVGILFIITIDPRKSTTPFASIIDVGYYGDKEDEVLFSMHTVFRIGEITSMNKNQRLFQVQLILTSDNDNDLRDLTERIREETDPDDEGWSRLGSLLLQVGEFAKAQQVYEILLEQTTDVTEKGNIFGQLGSTKYNQGEYNEAIKFYEKALEIYKETLSHTDLNLASCYNNIGAVYDNIGDYLKALSYYERALAIRKQSLPSNHPDFSMSYNNIGAVYSKMGDYPKALSSHEKALEIRKQSLPSNHPHLGFSYGNIGLVYSNMGDYLKALSYYEKALQIQKQSLPSNHPDFGMSYNNIGLEYSNMGDHQKALSYYEKALEIQKQSLPSNHPDLCSSYHNIGLVYSKMGDYPKALSYYEKDLEIQKQSLPSNHPDLCSSYNNIGLVYYNISDYPKAISYYEKALEIQKQSLPSNHPHLGSFFDTIGGLYSEMSDYPTARSYYEEALEIRQQSLSHSDPSLGNSYNNIGWACCKMGDYPEALSYCKKAIAIQEQSLPANHPELGYSYDTIGEVYCKIGDYLKALVFCEKAIAIQEQYVHENDTHLCTFYNNIGQVHEKMGIYPKALSFYERAVNIAQHSLPANRRNLQMSLQNLENIKKII